MNHASSHPAGHGITIGTPRFYDLKAGFLFFGTRRPSYRRLLMNAGVALGDRVLDVGCGTGYFARMVAQAVGPQGSVVGIDAAPEMIEYAGRKARRIANCRFQIGAAESIAFPDSSFDVVVSSLMMHHLPAELRLEAACEMSRALRPGGRLLLSDFSIPERGGWRVVMSISGHNADRWRRRTTPLETLAAGAGFTELRSGDVPPLLHYVRATKSVASGASEAAR
jgi:ubiquinone/menaquinone biosynthesis C-methylase UbiE